MSSNSTATKLSAFDGLTGAKRLVAKLSEPNSGVHAVLFYGAEGSGKSQLAQLLATSWLCKNPTEAGACYECQSCQAFGRNRNPDLLLIEPRGASALIALGAISESDPKTDEQPALREFFRTSPLMSKRKVAIIERADRMNLSATNSLLKTLEEPEAYARIILTTSEPSRVLATIRSRCLCVPCEQPSTLPLEAQGIAGPWIGFSRGRLQKATNNPAYAKVASFAKKLSQANASEALVLSDEFKEIGKSFDSEGSERANQVEALSVLADCLRSLPHVPTFWIQRIIETHRRVLGNGNAGIALDALFTGLFLR